MNSKIMLVDDGLSCSYLIEFAKEYHGLDIDWVKSPNIIVNNINDYRNYKIFILDIMFESNSGHESFDGIKLLSILRRKFGKDFIAIFSSARNEKLLNSKSLVNPGDYDYYFRKPYNMDELFNLLIRLLPDEN